MNEQPKHGEWWWVQTGKSTRPAKRRDDAWVLWETGTVADVTPDATPLARIPSPAELAELRRKVAALDEVVRILEPLRGLLSAQASNLEELFAAIDGRPHAELAADAHGNWAWRVRFGNERFDVPIDVGSSEVEMLEALDAEVRARFGEDVARSLWCWGTASAR